jgi:RNA-binding protein YlmH
MEDVEAQAMAAAESWSVEATAFLEPDVASQVETQFKNRGDILAFRVFGGRRLAPSGQNVSPGEGRRSRFVFVHPDLGLDEASAEAEYCTVIFVENVNLRASNTLPNALASIGVDLDQVGDIVVTDEETVYMVVDPSVAKPCMRLLSKELVGVGISLSVIDAHEFMPSGEIQEMKLSRILERKMDRKKFENGYVHLS